MRENSCERRCICQCSAENRTKRPFIAFTYWQLLPMHLQCSQHIVPRRLCTQTHTHRRTYTQTHSLALQSTLQSLIIDTSPCRIKQKLLYFQTDGVWCLPVVFFFLPPHSACFIVSVLRLTPPPHPIHCLILKSLNKTQIKTDNEESFPLSHFHLLWLLSRVMGGSVTIVCLCVCLCARVCYQ